jgi:hypothetical protein
MKRRKSGAAFQKKSGTALKRRTGAGKQKKSKGPRVALHLPKDAQGLVVRAQAISAGMKAQAATFNNPVPPLNEIDDEAKALAVALQQAEGGGTAEADAVMVAEDKLRRSLAQLALYADGVIRKGAVADAPALISAIQMYESKIGQRPPKPPLHAEDGPLTGMVKLIALALAGVTAYFWEWSLDQVNWTVGAQTTKARATLSGLTAGKVYYFRVRGLQRGDTLTPYVATIDLLVR